MGWRVTTSIVVVAGLVTACGSSDDGSSEEVTQLQQELEDLQSQLEATQAELADAEAELEAAQSAPPSSAPAATAPTEAQVEATTTAAPTTQAPTTTESPQERLPQISITDSVVLPYESFAPSANANALLTNNTDTDLFFVEVTFNFLSADGVPIATENTFIDVLPPGVAVPATTTASDIPAEPVPASVEVAAFGEEDSFITYEYTNLPIANVSINPGEFSSDVTGTIENTADRPAEFVEVGCTLRNAEGAPLAGVDTFTDTIAPGQTVVWEARDSVIDAAIAAGATTADCVAIATWS